MKTLLYVVFLTSHLLQYQCCPAERPGTCCSCQVPIIRSPCPLWASSSSCSLTSHHFTGNSTRYNQFDISLAVCDDTVCL
ncbi:uncharacterized protein BDV14DRAFT_170871 [Aspergillus stella-maris]|uniref:uncharacterized protein n=1 Tax=Aspergillus stella-maris TaxID=1810926 RepID=UPI003CCE0F93